jgi:hypothetical protein
VNGIDAAKATGAGSDAKRKRRKKKTKSKREKVWEMLTFRNFHANYIGLQSLLKDIGMDIAQ